MRVSVIGLGKLGLCTASCFAAKGTAVTGLDKNKSFIDSLTSRKSPVDETGLDEVLEKAWPNLSFTMDYAEAVSSSDISLIIVPTPSGPDGRFINDYLISAIESLAPALAAKKNFHIIDIVSTVMPGSCDGIFKPLLEKTTGKKVGKDIGLVYNPEFIALGSVIHNFLNPDMVLIGASDSKSSEAVKNLYASMTDSRPRFSTMSLVNAEVAKLSLNCFVTMKISFANELSALCEKIPGADIDDITNALGADTRIGPKYLKGGLGFGGPCFPRDNIAFQMCAGDHGYEANIGPEVVKINKAVVSRVFGFVASAVPKGSRVAVLGLSYKPHTHIIEESQSILLIKKLIDEGYAISVSDPKAIPSAKKELGNTISYSENPYDACNGASAIVLMTNWPEYINLDPRKLAAMAGKTVIFIDTWRSFFHARSTFPRYCAIGRGPDNSITENY
jgi:UDPglucose 6-dehydrogenase